MMEPEEKVRHVYPTGEEELHDLVGSRCRCVPHVFVDGDGVTLVTHNSFDGREWREVTNVRLN